MNRRQFLQTSAAVAAAPLLSNLAQADEPAPSDKLILCAPLTYSDWILKPNALSGEAGVKHMLDACKAAGWSRVMWRVFDAGRATYRSKLLRADLVADRDNFFDPEHPEDRPLHEKFMTSTPPARRKEILDLLGKVDANQFDSLGFAVDYGHQIGLKIHAWASINEDDHGWGWTSEFSKKHPECRWMRRDGRPYRSQLSFAFPEVRQYKLALLKEILDGYRVDGLFIDWIRTGDVRDNPQNDEKGLANYGYETPNVEAYKKQFGKDPHDVPMDDDNWNKVRAEPITAFMRDVKKLVASYSGREIPTCAMVGHPWHYRGFVDRIAGNLKGLLLDTKTWADEGLTDSILAAGYYRDGGTPEMAYKALKEETAGKLDVWTYAWVPQNAGDFDRDFNLAKSVGAKQILFWEADYIDDRKNAEELKTAMSAKAKW